MSDIEEYARFQFPKFVSCYIDVVRFFLKSSGKSEAASEIPELSLWLEYGAFKKTQISLMALGLSRLSAIAVSDYLTEDDLDELGCIERLKQMNLASRDLSPIIIEEAMRVLNVVVKI